MVLEKNVVDQLIADWDEMIAMEWMAKEELIVSLQDQISGLHDMSLDEYDVFYAQFMGAGWDEVLTDEQCDIWRNVFNDAARKYLAR